MRLPNDVICLLDRPWPGGTYREFLVTLWMQSTFWRSEVGRYFAGRRA
jgi:hypothetical protein